MNTDGTLDEAYERLHATGPEYDGWLSNHGPMAVEAMVRHGEGRAVHRWLDGYVRRLEERPGGASAIDDWREALGDARRLGDWLAYFDREVRERPWREVLATWWPRLLPGIAAGSTHGVIRTGHATHTLLLGAGDGPRLAELGQALGYWAARWQAVPVPGAPSGTATTDEALAAVPRVPDQSKGIRYRFGQLDDLPGWASALAAPRPPGSAGEARRRLAELADTATLRYLTHGHGSGVMLVHAATTPTAVLRTLPALPETLWAASLDAAWAASAAVTAAYAPEQAAPRADLPVAPAENGAADEVFDHAVRHGDEHAIKLADTAVEVFERTGNADALGAALRATELIAAVGA